MVTVALVFICLILFCRYLVKTYKEKNGGRSVQYLVNPPEPKVEFSLDGLVNLYRQVAAGLVKVAVDHLDGLVKNGAPAYEAWNSSAVLLIKAAQAHARYFVTECYVRSINESNLSAPVRLVLNQLCELFLIFWLLERVGDFVMVT